MVRFHPLLLLTTAFVTACSAGSLPRLPADQIATGTWGGTNAGMIVSDSGTHVHIGCTLGDLPALVTLDEAGRFGIDGSYVLDAFPIMVGPRLPARFTGRVSGRTLTLTVTVDDTVRDRAVILGPVSLRYGRTPEMGPCPICRTAPRWQP